MAESILQKKSGRKVITMRSPLQLGTPLTLNNVMENSSTVQTESLVLWERGLRQHPNQRFDLPYA